MGDMKIVDDSYILHKEMVHQNQFDISTDQIRQDKASFYCKLADI